MPAAHDDDRLLVKYLLGNLSETEQECVEDRAFNDASYLTELEASEADLIDTYVRGGLSQVDRRAFERQFLAVPDRRKKVEFAKALARIATESRQAEPPLPRQTWFGLLRGWRPPLGIAVALATLFCVIGMSWLTLQNVAMRSRIRALEAQRLELEQREQPRHVDRQQQTVRPTTPQPKQQQSAVPSVVATLAFIPGLSRAAAKPGQLVLTPSTQIVSLDIHLDARDDYPRYRAELRTRSGEEVLTRANLRRHGTTAGYAVSFDVPASTLPSGNYELALKGLVDSRSAVDIAYHYFSVRKQ
jgi:hypothetical protein